MKKSILIIVLFISISYCKSQPAKNFIKSGLINLKAQDYYGAIEEYNKAIKINPKDAKAYFLRGISKNMINGYELRNIGCLDLSKAGELGYTEAYDVIKEVCQ